MFSSLFISRLLERMFIEISDQLSLDDVCPPDFDER